MLATSVLFALASALAAEASFRGNIRPFWVLNHSPLVATRLDPVVAPGLVSAHAHAFAGGNNLAPVIDYDNSLKSSCTTSEITDDKSNYWAPQLYRKTGKGEEVEMQPLLYVTTYYEAFRKGQEAIYEFPPGFRMMAGSATRSTPLSKSDPLYDATSYSCLDYKGGQTPYEHGFPERKCPDGLRLQVGYPSCWDGVNNWLKDSKHVAYPTGGYNQPESACPSSHPKRLVKLFAEYVYQDDYDYVPGARVLASGDTTGYGAHGDFANGWREGLISEIVNQGAACDVFGDFSQCAPLANIHGPRKTCPFAGATADEETGEGAPIPKLPGNNPIYGSEGSGRSAGYTETVGMKGGQARDAKQDQIPTTIVRKAYFSGDPGYKAGGEIESGSSGSSSGSTGGGVQANEKVETEPTPEVKPVTEESTPPTPIPSPSTSPVPETETAPVSEPIEPVPVPSALVPAPAPSQDADPIASDISVPPPAESVEAPPAAAPAPAPVSSSDTRGGSRGGWRGGRNRLVTSDGSAALVQAPAKPNKACPATAAKRRRSIVSRSRRSRR